MPSPHTSEMNETSTDIIRQELITYERSPAGLKRTTVVREFYNNDYTDSVHEVILNGTVLD